MKTFLIHTPLISDHRPQLHELSMPEEYPVQENALRNDFFYDLGQILKIRVGVEIERIGPQSVGKIGTGN